MTNLFAVQIDNKDDPLIYCVADSQASGQTEKTSNVQKLIQRGRNLIMATSNYAPIAWTIFSRLENDDIPADCLAGRVLEVSKDLAKEHEGDFGKITRLFVAGPGAKIPEMYEIEIVTATHQKKDDLRTKRGITQKRGLYTAGSGSEQIGPAFKRDQEMGYARHPISPVEGLLLVYGVGHKANTDLWVNEKLQIGVVSAKEGTRMILPPGTEAHSELDYKNAYGPLTGIDFSKVPPEKRSGLLDVPRTVEEFYHALETTMKRVESRTIQTNNAHNMHIRGEIDVDAYLAFCLDRAQHMHQAEQYVDAFTKGGIERIANAVIRFSEDALN